MKRNRVLMLLAVAVFGFTLVSGCTLPRIVVVKDPLTPEEHLNLGVAYERSGEFDNAIKEYSQAAKKQPAAYLYLGNAYFQKEDWARAEDSYRKAIERDPGNADARNNLAWLYYSRGIHLDEAERLAIEAILINPSKGHIYNDTLDKIRQKKGR